MRTRKSLSDFTNEEVVQRLERWRDSLKNGRIFTMEGMISEAFPELDAATVRQFADYVESIKPFGTAPLTVQ